MKIRKGDQVKIISGKDRGKQGNVLRVFPNENKILVEGVNLSKKHRKAKGKNAKGERVVLPMPIDTSNAQMICSGCSKPTRVGLKEVGEKKVRVCKKCQKEL